PEFIKGERSESKKHKKRKAPKKELFY
ncbi:MAG: hypothetical protein ACI8P3_004483, partial [Saprospiraceae bacterium]